jgi:carboxyl-terminal processing protease
MDKTNLYFNAFQNTFWEWIRYRLIEKKNKDIVKRYLAAEFAWQLYGESIETFLKEDAMVKAVLK